MVTGEKRIQAYVDLSTYESLKSQAKDRNMSLSELVDDILQAHSMVDSSWPIGSNCTENHAKAETPAL